MEFEAALKLYQFPIKQKLAKTIINRMPYARDELPTINTSEIKVMEFILKHKDVISDHEKIAEMYKNKFTKDVEKHWPIKFSSDDNFCKNNITNDLNEFLDKQAIPRIVLRALEYYYPERLNIIKKRGNKNINNYKGKIKLTAIAVNENLTDEIIKVLNEIKIMEMIPAIFEKAVINSKKSRPHKKEIVV